MSQDWKMRYELEYAIVDRVWAALGITSFEQAHGKSISELVAELRAAAERYRLDWYETTKALEQAQARVDAAERMAEALEQIQRATGYEHWTWYRDVARNGLDAYRALTAGP